MNSIRNRPAYLTDLNNYFLKNDLLGGLTTLEQERVRFNIGVLSSSGNDNCTISPVTYLHLLNLLQNKLLIPGKKYIITDFQTIYSSNIFVQGKALTWGLDINPSKVYHLLVVAITTDTIGDNICILLHPDWIVKYKFLPETLPDGIQTKGKIVFLKDTNNNSAYYNFKDIKFRRIIDNKSLDLFTFSNYENNVLEDASNYKSTVNNTFEQGCYNNVFLGTTYNNLFLADSINNTFHRGCNDVTLSWESCNNDIYETVRFLEGKLPNIHLPQGDTTLSSTISKTIHKVNDKTIVSFLDPVTYAYQIIIL